MLEVVVVDCGLVVGISVCLCIFEWLMFELCECGEKFISEVN